MKLSLSKYKLIIFDWDGTLVDSVNCYKAWDKRYVKKFYNVDLPLTYFEDLSKELKDLTPSTKESRYFRYLDETHGDGTTASEKIWENIYSLAPEIQGEVMYQPNAVAFLQTLRSSSNVRLALGTNAELRDIRFFSSKHSKTAEHLSPLDFFDSVVTSDDVDRLKPHPETFEKLIKMHDVNPTEVLIFEDSMNGVRAARSSGADVVAIHADEKVNQLANFSLSDWAAALSLLDAELASH